MSKKKHPPSDEARIELFLALVEDYRELAETLPVDRSMRIGGRRDPKDHWHRLLRAFALRKFVAQHDPIYLPAVAESLEAVLPLEYRGEGGSKDGMTELLKETEDGQVAYGTDEKRAKEIVFDTLYGRYLHGDYDKWKRSTERDQFLLEHAMWGWLRRVEDCVFDLSKELQQLREDGTLPRPENATAEVDDGCDPKVSLGD